MFAIELKTYFAMQFVELNSLRIKVDHVLRLV